MANTPDLEFEFGKEWMDILSTLDPLPLAVELRAESEERRKKAETDAKAKRLARDKETLEAHWKLIHQAIAGARTRLQSFTSVDIHKEVDAQLGIFIKRYLETCGYHVELQFNSANFPSAFRISWSG
jgi:hypothetical protein